jgi:hypothetical protein
LSNGTETLLTAIPRFACGVRDDARLLKNRAMQELNSGLKPALKTKVEKIGSYDVILWARRLGGVR